MKCIDALCSVAHLTGSSANFAYSLLTSSSDWPEICDVRTMTSASPLISSEVYLPLWARPISTSFALPSDAPDVPATLCAIPSSESRVSPFHGLAPADQFQRRGGRAKLAPGPLAALHLPIFFA